MENDKKPVIINPELDMTSQMTVHSNLRQDIICTTKDKLQLSLQSFQSAIEAKQEIFTYGGIFLSLLITQITSSAKDAFGLTAEVWNAIIIVALFLSGIATACSLVKFLSIAKNRDIDEICKKIMGQEGE